MKILVGESPGASGEDVDCGEHCLSTFNDLRFTKADGTTLLDFYIESITGTTPNQLATVWVEFDSIGTSDTTFYMYYGKADAAAASSGADTFIGFDDFERGSDGDAIGGIWTADASDGVISIDHAFGGTRSAKILGTSSDWTNEIKASVTASGDIAIQFRFWKENASHFNVYHGNGSKYSILRYEADGDIIVDDTDTGVNCLEDQWDFAEYRNYDFSSGTFDVYYTGGDLAKSGALLSTGTSSTNVIQFYDRASGVGNDTYIDNFIVRNYRATEPAFGAWGSEETLVAIDVPEVSLALSLYAPATFPAFAPAITLQLSAQAPSVLSVVSVSDPISLLLGTIAPAPVSAFYPSNISLTLADINPAYYWTIPANKRPAVQTIFTLTLTGDNESPALSDLTLPMSSFQMRLQYGGNPNYLSAVVPNAVDYESDITARANGELVIRMGYKYQDGTTNLEELARADFNELRVDTGAHSSSATLGGYDSAPSYTSPKERTLSDVSYRALYEDGKRRLRAKIDMFLRPGDTVIYGTDEYVVGELVYFINPTTSQMEVVEE